MNDSVVIVYNGEQVSVPKEVADFLEQDRKRQQAQDKQDARHLSKSEFETVLSGSNCVKRPVEDAVLRNLRLENLRGAITEPVSYTHLDVYKRQVRYQRRYYFWVHFVWTIGIA